MSYGASESKRKNFRRFKETGITVYKREIRKRRLRKKSNMDWVVGWVRDDFFFNVFGGFFNNFNNLLKKIITDMMR